MVVNPYKEWKTERKLGTVWYSYCYRLVKNDVVFIMEE